jgi:hypothetical protein
LRNNYISRTTTGWDAFRRGRSRDHRLRRLVIVFDSDGIGRAASLAMLARRSSGSAGIVQ